MEGGRVARTTKGHPTLERFTLVKWRTVKGRIQRARQKSPPAPSLLPHTTLQQPPPPGHTSTPTHLPLWPTPAGVRLRAEPDKERNVPHCTLARRHARVDGARDAAHRSVRREERRVLVRCDPVRAGDGRPAVGTAQEPHAGACAGVPFLTFVWAQLKNPMQ
eukprot:34517-Chlamydomonas_euryale.AAC.1